MTRDELKRLLSEAGIKFDGHVTNGSIEEQMKVVWPLVKSNGLSESEYIKELNEFLSRPEAIDLLRKLHPFEEIKRF